MTQLLIKTSFVTVPAGGSVVVTHDLSSAGRPVAPSLILPDRVTALVVSAVTDATYTVSNGTPNPLSATFRAEYGYSPEVSPSGLLPMYWQGGASGGGVSSVAATTPITVSGPASAPVIGLGYTANFTQTLGNFDLADTGVGAGGYGNAAALPESTFPTFSVDAKGRITTAVAAGVQINGLGARAYVDGGDSATLAAANLYAQSLAFNISSKDAAHTATDAPLAAYTVDVTKKILTATAPGSINPVGGHTVVAGDRVLVKNETAGNAPNNGVYVVTTVGDGLNPWVLTRSADADSNTELCGALVPVETGTFAGTVWLFSANSATFNLGVTNVIWTQLSVPAATVGALGSIQLAGGLGGALSSATLPKLDVGHVTSGTLPVAHGGTGLATAGGTANRAFYTADGATLTVGLLPNAALANSSVTITAGTGLSGGGSVALGGSTTLSLPNVGPGVGSHGSASQVPVFTLDAQGRVTVVTATSIAIDAAAVTTGTFTLSMVAGPTGVGFGVTSATGVWAAATVGGTSQLVGFNASSIPSAITIGPGLSLSAGTLSATGSGGTVTSVGLSGGTTGLTISGTNPITSSGTFTLGGTLATAHGGTGLSTPFAATGALLYTSSGNSFTLLAAGAAGTVLTSNGAGVAPSYQAVSSATTQTFAYRAVSTTDAWLPASDYILNTTGSSSFTVTLPTAVGAAGRAYILKHSGTGTITVATTSSQSIDGASSLIVATQYTAYTFVSNGSNWIII